MDAVLAQAMGCIPAPLTPLTASPFFPDGLHNSPDLWSSPGAMSQSSYGAMLGSSSSPLPQSASFNSLHQHERMVTSPAVPPSAPCWGRVGGQSSRTHLNPLPPSLQNYQLHSGEVNGGLPSVSGFSSASTPYGVSSHTPPISGTDTMMGTCPPLPEHLTDTQGPSWKTKAPLSGLEVPISAYLHTVDPFCVTGDSSPLPGCLRSPQGAGRGWMWALPSS